jgi:hypothetical protein
VYVEGILGDRTQPLPLHVAPQVEIAGQRRLPPAVGYPLPVRADGTIAPPLLEPVPVQGLSTTEVEDALRKRYVAKELLKAGTERVIVTVMHPRQYQVVVLRQESGNIAVGPAGQIAGGKRGTGYVVDLPGYENDVLHALAQTGGLPGLDAYNAVIIQRGCFDDEPGRAAVLRALEAAPNGCGPQGLALPCRETFRIPLRGPCGKNVPFQPEDVLLHTGDVVFLEARDYDVFFTGGLLPSGEHVLPRDRDLDVLEAVTRVQGPLLNGGFAINNLSGQLIQSGVGGPSPSDLVVIRRTPGGGEVPIRVDLNKAMYDPRERIIIRPGDLLVLQEAPEEALARYVTQTFFNFNLFWEPIHSKHAVGVVDVSSPDRLTPRIGQITQPLLPP